MVNFIPIIFGTCFFLDLWYYSKNIILLLIILLYFYVYNYLPKFLYFIFILDHYAS